MFGVGVSEYRFPRRRMTFVVVAGLLPGLAACSSVPSMPSMPSTGSFSSLFGSSSSAGNAQASATSTPLPPNFECPDVTVRSGASTLTSSADPAQPTALNLRHQVTIGTTARECRLLPNNVVSIKVGMQGRVILGPEGVPGTVNVPVRYAVVREGIDPKPITTKLDRVTVTVPPNDGNVLFTHVTEGLEFPMPRAGEIDSYVVYIGFDTVAAQEMERPRPKPKPAARRKVS